MEQTYPGVEDYKAHFMEMLPAFKDKRYIKVDGKLLFGVFAGYDIPDCNVFFETWNRLAKENGLEGFEFFALALGEKQLSKVRRLGFDRIVYDACLDTDSEKSILKSKVETIMRHIFHRPYIISYSKYVENALRHFKVYSWCTPCIDPNFDHTPRSGVYGSLLHNSNPVKWGYLCKHVKKHR